MGSGGTCQQSSDCCGNAYCWEYGQTTSFQCVNPVACTFSSYGAWTEQQCVRPTNLWGISYCTCPSPLSCTSGPHGLSYCTRVCPSGPWTLSSDATICTSGWSTTWENNAAGASCTGAGHVFPPLDYSNHPYTCVLTPPGPWSVSANFKTAYSGWSSSWNDVSSKAACLSMGYSFPALDYSHNPYTCVMSS